MPAPRIEFQHAARNLREQVHPRADCVLLAGSFVRGEASATSDLDLVVIYAELPCAYRESLVWEGYPVEMFVHTIGTLRYFFEKLDGPSGFPKLAQMVNEGLEIPAPTALSGRAKELAAQVLQAGPPPLSADELNRRRYHLTDLIEDLRDPRSPQELRATATQLYNALADFVLRSHHQWSATGKTVPRKLQNFSPALAQRFESAFEALFVSGEQHTLIALTEELLAPFGGFLFEGYRLDAPTSFVISNQEENHT